jgi:hypothetical protein
MTYEPGWLKVNEFMGELRGDWVIGLSWLRNKLSWFGGVIRKRN